LEEPRILGMGSVETRSCKVKVAFDTQRCMMCQSQEIPAEES